MEVVSTRDALVAESEFGGILGGIFNTISKKIAFFQIGILNCRFPLPPALPSQALIHGPTSAVAAFGKQAMRYASREGLPGG